MPDDADVPFLVPLYKSGRLEFYDDTQPTEACDGSISRIDREELF